MTLGFSSLDPRWCDMQAWAVFCEALRLHDLLGCNHSIFQWDMPLHPLTQSGLLVTGPAPPEGGVAVPPGVAPGDCDAQNLNFSLSDAQLGEIGAQCSPNVNSFWTLCTTCLSSISFGAGQASATH